jgi:NADH-quinone oxidoreductase subunit I
MASVSFVAFALTHVPFYALFMTNDYELSAFTKEHLIYTPAQLAVKPKYQGDVEIVIDDRGATHG